MPGAFWRSAPWPGTVPRGWHGHYRPGGALISLDREPFDLVFLDADKSGYVEYLELSLQLSHPGTVILADNVIRHGRVMEPQPPDTADAGARAYNYAIARHPRLESLVLPSFAAASTGWPFPS